MTKVLVIGGGDTYATYEEYVEHLEKSEIELQRMKPRDDWKKNLENSLGEGYEVFIPTMPLRDNASYSLWELWYKKIVDAMNGPNTIIGHSLGAMFLAKYYSENISKKQVESLFLVAPVYCGDENQNHQCHSFSLKEDIEIIKKNVKNILFFFSEDDFVIPFENCNFYKKALPDAIYTVFKDRGHFLQESFPELVDEIKKLPQTDY